MIFRKKCGVLLSLSIAFLLCLSVVAYAAALPYSVVEGGNTILRTFKLSDQPADVVDYFESIINSPRSVIVSFGSGSYGLFIVPEDEELYILRGAAGSSSVSIFADPSGFNQSLFRVLRFRRSSEGDFFECYSTGSALESGLSNIIHIAGGKYWQGYTFPTLDYNYLADVQGSLIIEWDTQEDSGDGGLMDWLSDFWGKLVGIFKDLFIPRDGYFTDFFNELKTAFDAKLGGLSDLMTSLSDMFNSLKNHSGGSSFVITFPDDQFYDGYRGASVNVFEKMGFILSWVRGLLNSILILLTIVCCYKKLVEIVKT